ncbi:aminotransferase class I/II-fold pyridoxal phosphate-dependent enzyme [Bradyrhizobium sp.]|uniref:MocR-like pyridoxine biosynthesis transcription factor PdxR n=1 Tax=Bradyrhizobium sp. TaxID=376 RepID=UPI0039E60E10
MQLLILLDRTRRESLTDQLVEQIRLAIAKGRIAAGARLPSSRNLADQLAISRNTVVRAYESLILEGHAEARPASGIFVAERAPVTAGVAPASGPASERPSVAPAPPVFDTELKRLAVRKERRMVVDFALDQTNPAVFPLKTWRRLVQNHLSHGAASQFATANDPAGAPELRAAIAHHQSLARGLAVDPTQVIITSGRNESLSLIARMLLSYDARVVMEDPGYLGAYLSFRSAGARVIACPVDENGLVTDLLPERGCAMVHVTPSHQFPTGTLLSAQRRKSLAGWARRNGSLIVEDGFGDEFHDEGMQLAPLSSLAPDCVLYVGDFAASLGSGLKLGYLVVPQRYAEAARLTKAMLNAGVSWLDQAVLAEFLSSGPYAAHVLRVRAHYRAGRNMLIASLRRCFGDVTLGGGNAGLQLFWQLPPGVPQAQILELQARRGRIGVYSLHSAPVHVGETGTMAKRGILLGFGGLSERQIEKGIAKLSDIVDDALDDHLTEIDQLLIDLPPDRPPIPTARIRGMAASAKKHEPALTTRHDKRPEFGALAQFELGSAMPLLKSIYHYPVKGLSGQPLTSARLTRGQPFPHDRQFALARPGVPLQADNPRWAKKGLFVMLMLEEALAKVKTHLDPETLQFEIRAGNQTILVVNLNESGAKARIEDYFHQLVPTLPAPPTLVRSKDGHFMDKPDSVISLINLATLRSLEERWGTEIDPLRFRANLYVDTGRAWEEFDWIDQEIRLGDVTFRVDRRNGRCGATNVNPASGVRDMDIPGSLRANFGHKDLGVYLTVETGGTIAVEDRLTRPSAATQAFAPTAKPNGSAGRRFICRGCYYIYSEDAGVPADGIAPGTAYQQLPENFRCPDCGTDKGKLRPHVA